MLEKIYHLLAAELDITAFMRELVREHQAVYPRHDWQSIFDINWDETSAMAHWLDCALRRNPPVRQKVLYFGLFNPVDQGADLYLAGSRTFALDGIWWGEKSKGDYWPDLRYAQSRCLTELYARCYPNGPTEAGDSAPGNDGENMLGVGYAARLCLDLFRAIAPERALSGPQSKVGLAVGWDSGDPLTLGFMTRSGVALRSPADAIAAARAYVAVCEARFRAHATTREDRRRYFRHPDGRRWEVEPQREGVYLRFTDGDGDVHNRFRSESEGAPEEIASNLVAEQLAAGFVEEGKPSPDADGDS